MVPLVPVTPNPLPPPLPLLLLPWPPPLPPLPRTCKEGVGILRTDDESERDEWDNKGKVSEDRAVRLIGEATTSGTSGGNDMTGRSTIGSHFSIERFIVDMS